jgi:hypothetical protein
MARIPVSRPAGTFVKWSGRPKGSEFSGRFRGLREGKYGLLADLETEAGVLTLPVPTALERQLARVRVGAEGVVVQYLGLAHNERTGRDYHNFEVFVGDQADLEAAAAPAARTGAPVAEAEVPF